MAILDVQNISYKYGKGDLLSGDWSGVMAFNKETVGYMTVDELKRIIDVAVGSKFEGLLPSISEYVAITITESAREACRCAMCDEIDYIAEKGNELYNQAKSMKRAPSTFKDV